MALLAVLLSCCGWLCPDFGILRKGFTVPEQPGPLAWFILVSWYVLVFVSLSLGQRLGVLFTGERSGHGLKFGFKAVEFRGARVRDRRLVLHEG